MDIVVGYDGSDFSMQALDWAMDEAELRRAELTVCHAWRWPYGEADRDTVLHLRKAAEHVLWHGADCVRHTSSLTRVQTDLYEGDAADRLVELSASAELVVVGSRGLTGAPSAALGSVAARVAAGARCPVVVVRGPGPLPAAAHPGPVVVVAPEGVPDIVPAFAFREAALRRLTLRIAGESALGRWRDQYPGIEHGRLDGTSSLLVVGRAGAGDLGEPARRLLDEARCPVVVVPVD
ncbi:universal stress protein [Nonomuraea soli]|uniref:Nucleotide-binding universal stress UspA family protein n=1 Tax=Nonomuraea soli TaxID=1032476 RepID=A0A7W0CFA4_9ACTN|nr:universal stress protein [Nonomuraea soli]MBA2889967.1 nucleotide-binding universal stress UspA family protein [Nonomuraea soli]